MIYMYDLLTVSLTPPTENSRMDLLHDFTKLIVHILARYVIRLAKNLNFCAILQEGAE